MATAKAIAGASRLKLIRFGHSRRGAFDEVSIGLYAVRCLDEIDDGSLSLALCRLDGCIGVEGNAHPAHSSKKSIASSLAAMREDPPG